MPGYKNNIEGTNTQTQVGILVEEPVFGHTGSDTTSLFSYLKAFLYGRFEHTDHNV